MSRSRPSLVAAVVVSSVLGVRADVRFGHDRVTARFEPTPLADAVREVAAATGGELHGGVVAPRDVTLELEAVPLDEALHRLPAPQSFTVRYGEGGRVKAIVLRGGPQASPPPRETPTAAGVPVEKKPTFPIVLSRMFLRQRPIELSDPLAEIVSGDDDGGMRALASQAVLSALEHEGRYQRSLLRSLHQLDPEGMSAIANGPSGERLRELMEHLAAHSREPTLQKKAGVVLEQLQGARAGEGT